MPYQVKKGEEGYVHATLQRLEFNPDTGKELFKPYNHICTPKEFENFLKHSNGLKVIEILHLPKGYKVPKNKVDGKLVDYDAMILPNK